MALRAELAADVQTLAGEIGERNMRRYPQLNAAADFIEDSFSRAGLRPRRDTYELNGRACHNIEAEIRGVRPQIVVIGAHYDSVFGSRAQMTTAAGSPPCLRSHAVSPENRSGKPCASLPSRMKSRPISRLSRWEVSFTRAGVKARGDQISAMISLETIGYFSDAPRSQTYPSLGLGAFYPTTGNFIGFVGNFRSRTLLRRAIALFRQQGKLPSEGAALPSFIPGVGWSDQWAFWQHGYPGIMITDTAPFRYPHYHAATDTPDKLDYDRFALVVSGVEKMIEELAK